jgi:hypothetical protein
MLHTDRMSFNLSPPRSNQVKLNFRCRHSPESR